MRSIKGTTEYTRGYRPHETFQYEIQRERERARERDNETDRLRRRLDAWLASIQDARANMAVIAAQAAKFRAQAETRRRFAGLVARGVLSG